MDAIARRSIAGAGQLFAVLAAALFGAARTLRFWQAWVYLAVFFACVTAVTIDLLKRDRALLERRLRAGPAAERETIQKIIQALAALCFIAIFVIAGLDRGAHVEPAISLVADAAVAGGFAIVWRTFRANTFTAAVVEVQEGQRVIDTGPYALVRHPMYAGGILLVAATPPALGSWRALIPAALLAVAVVARLLHEERLLAKELAGYDDYRRKVRWRLIPRVW